MWYAPGVDASGANVNMGEACPGTPGRATVRRVWHHGAAAVLKDFSADGLLFRWTCGVYLAQREAAAYRRLAGVAGVPRLLGRTTPDGLLIAYVPGRNCMDTASCDFTPGFFDELRDILRRVRARHVLHGDVKRNVVRTLDGRPVLVDFGASLVIPWWLRSLRGMLVHVAERYDERAVAKLKRLVAPQLLTPCDDRVLGTRLPFERLVKFGERVLQRCTASIVRRSTRARPSSLVAAGDAERSNESAAPSRAA